MLTHSMPMTSFSTPLKTRGFCSDGMKLVTAVRVIDPGDLYYLCEKSLPRRSFFKNVISSLLNLGQAVKTTNSSCTKSTKATRHKRYDI